MVTVGAAFSRVFRLVGTWRLVFNHKGHKEHKEDKDQIELEYFLCVLGIVKSRRIIHEQRQDET